MQDPDPPARLLVISGELVGRKMDALAHEFHETHDLKVKEEIDRLASELVKLDKAWVFVAR